MAYIEIGLMLVGLLFVGVAIAEIVRRIKTKNNEWFDHKL